MCIECDCGGPDKFQRHLIGCFYYVPEKLIWKEGDFKPFVEVSK